MTTDCNTSYGTYTTDGNAGTYHIYYGDPYPYDVNEPYRIGRVYPWQESPPVTVITNIVEVPAPEPQNNRKENDMIERQTFLDALADEGKAVTVEERELIRCAMDDKWTLLIARLLARVFESADLVMLKEKPKEVLVTTKEA